MMAVPAHFCRGAGAPVGAALGQFWPTRDLLDRISAIDPETSGAVLRELVGRMPAEPGVLRGAPPDARSWGAREPVHRVPRARTRLRGNGAARVRAPRHHPTSLPGRGVSRRTAL